MSQLTKKRLEILLQKCETFDRPKVYLEQYTIPSDIAAEILYLAYLKGDIEGKVVYDLGCGTGKLAIGCALLKAKKVFGFEVDREALEVARKNASNIGVDVNWIEGDIAEVEGHCDTVIQNPPFGVQREKADRVFLEKALQLGKVIYSMHKMETREFVVGYVQKLGGETTDIMPAEFALPHSYEFHKRAIGKTKVDVYRILSKSWMILKGGN